MNYKQIKRATDVSVSFTMLILTFPIILVCWICASIDTCSNGFFFQKRIGLNGHSFFIIKIKTMVNSIDNTMCSPKYSPQNILRCTALGKFLRRSKLDELPQLVNIFLGDMSFVGPRPALPEVLCAFYGENALILSVRPGLTSIASIKYRYEEDVLSLALDPVHLHKNIFWPDKLILNLYYVKNISFWLDCLVVSDTLLMSKHFETLRSGLYSN